MNKYVESRLQDVVDAVEYCCVTDSTDKLEEILEEIYDEGYEDAFKIYFW